MGALLGAVVGLRLATGAKGFAKALDTFMPGLLATLAIWRLAELFTEKSEGKYAVGRWGGEEFCFFFPNVNIDVAGEIITGLLIDVRRMELAYEGHRFSITLTAGVEENDYRSSLTELIESADRKLYRGKQNGRNQIVF